MSTSTRTDVLVVVPKRDELTAVAAVFGFVASSGELLDNTYEYWRVKLADLSVAVVLARSQNSTNLAMVTQKSLDTFEPAVAICVGTGAGKVGVVSFLDVLLATAVLDGTEWRAENGELQTQWDKIYQAPKESLDDVDNFVKATTWRARCLEHYKRGIDALKIVEPIEESGSVPRVRDCWMVTTGFLFVDFPQLLATVWGVNARLRILDMETAGFVAACTTGSRLRPWFVIRSVSDFGTVETRVDTRRPPAAVAAAAVARSFIEEGLGNSNPLRIDPFESEDMRLSSDNFFQRLTMPDFLAAALKEKLGVSIDPDVLMADVNVTDLATLCQGAGRTHDETKLAMDTIREQYFTEKYLNYNDESDLRGRINLSWAQDIKDAYAFLKVDPKQSDILYVGVSTGRDLAVVCPEFRRLVGVDLSVAMLERAKLREPNLEIVRDSAEELSSVDDESVDLYISLRTYQSSLFDATAALRQAFRVLRPSGSLLLSIPTGFLDNNALGEPVFVPGLLIPGSDLVDRGRPRNLAHGILRQLDNLMFTKIGFHQRETDLYIYARKAGADR
jgi:nucleoside phosphorylase/SAM-dependent methyltransferase